MQSRVMTLQNRTADADSCDGERFSGVMLLLLMLMLLLLPLLLQLVGIHTWLD